MLADLSEVQTFLSCCAGTGPTGGIAA